MSEETLAAARVLATGFSVIPLKARSKEPVISWTEFQERLPTDRELIDWFLETDNNIGLVMGAISRNAFAIDFDDARLARFAFNLDKLAKETFVQETLKGVHVVLRLEGGPVRSHNYRDRGLPLDVKGEGGYIVAAPSVHPDGTVYRMLSPDVQVGRIERKELEDLIEDLAEEWPIAQVVLSGYAEGRRHETDLGLAAWLRRRGFSKGRSTRFVRRLCRVSEDPEVEDRLRAVEDTFAKPETEISVAGVGPDILADLNRVRPPISPETEDKGGLPVGLASLAADLSQVIEFSRPEDALLCILAAAQPQLGPGILPEKCLAYVCFDGPKSSGKTVATEAVVEIAGGKMIRGGTLSAMVRILTGETDGLPPNALGIDEVDSMQARLPDLQGILRTGNRWNAEYPISVPKGKGWETRPMNVGGFKAFNYSGEPDDATQTRCLMIRMRPVEDSARAAHLAVESLFNNPILTAIRQRLAGRAASAKREWNAAKMEDHMKAAEFKARVARLDSILPRGKQLGAVLLAVADAMGWSDEAERVIASYIAERREDSLENEREVLAEIVSLHLNEIHDGYIELQNAEVLSAANQSLKSRSLNPISKYRWPSLREEFKIESGRRSKGLLLRFGPSSFKALGLEIANATGETRENRVDSSIPWIPVDAPGLEERLKPFGIPLPTEGYIALRADGTPIWSKRGPKPTGPRDPWSAKPIVDRIKNDLRWNRDKPDSWVALDAVLALQLPQEPENVALLEEFVASMRKGMDP